jgi:hypothetical protein
MKEQTVRLRPQRVQEAQPSERRDGTREPCKWRPVIRILTRPSFQVRQAMVADVSATGLGLLLQERLAPGTVLAIQLQGKHIGVSRILSARVVHVIPHSDGTWHIGCALSTRLTKEERECLLWEGP